MAGAKAQCQVEKLDARGILFNEERRRRRFERRVAYVSELIIEVFTEADDPKSLTVDAVAREAEARFVKGFYGALMLSSMIEFLPVVIQIVMRAIRIWLTDEFPWTDILDKILLATNALASGLANPNVDYHEQVIALKKRITINIRGSRDRQPCYPFTGAVG